MYISLRSFGGNVMIRTADQNEGGPFDTQPPSSNGNTNPDNATPTSISTGLDLPAISRPAPSDSTSSADALDSRLHPSLTQTPTKGLDQGAIIAILLAVIVLIMFILAIIDIAILSSGVKNALTDKTRKFLNRYKWSSSIPPPQIIEETHPFDAKPLPPEPPTEAHPAYVPSIPPSTDRRRYSSSSGYSSQYSRPDSYDSGIGVYPSTENENGASGYRELDSAYGGSGEYGYGYGYGGMGPKPGYAKSYVSTVGWRPWDDDDARSEVTRYTAKSYRGRIRPGMGVGKWEEDGTYSVYSDASSMYAQSVYMNNGNGEVGVPMPSITVKELNVQLGGSGAAGVIVPGAAKKWYGGKSRPGMGVQKLPTVLDEEQMMRIQKQHEERDKQNFELYKRFWRKTTGASGATGNAKSKRMSTFTFR